MRILIAEDDLDLNSVIVRRLLSDGMQVEACFDGRSALAKIFNMEYDVVVLDIMMPELDGLSIVRRMRDEDRLTPVLLLTAKDSIEDRVRGLDAGADDYLTKPFALEELSARIRALSRRKGEHFGEVFRLEDLTLDVHRRIVTRSGVEIELSTREFAILEYMIRNAGLVLTREQIEHHIWDYEYVSASNIVDVYIRNLRKKIDNDYEPKLIQTVRSVGYTLRAK